MAMTLTGATTHRSRRTRTVSTVQVLGALALALGLGIVIGRASAPAAECEATAPNYSLSDRALGLLPGGPVYGDGAVLIVHPAFQPNEDGEYFGYISVFKEIDAPLSGTLEDSDGAAGELVIESGAALSGLQRVPASVPNPGCWKLTLQAGDSDPTELVFRI